MVTYLWIQPSKMMLKIQWKFKSVNTYHTRNVIPAQNVTFVLKFKDLRVLRTHFIEDIWDCRDELVSYAWRGTEKFRSRIKTVHGKWISWVWSKIILKTLGDNITSITLSSWVPLNTAETSPTSHKYCILSKVLYTMLNKHT